MQQGEWSTSSDPQSYTIYDTSSLSTATCQGLEVAIRMVEAALSKEEKKGRRVQREFAGRWAIYDGNTIDLLWIEANNGSVVSFAR